MDCVRFTITSPNIDVLEEEFKKYNYIEYGRICDCILECRSVCMPIEKEFEFRELFESTNLLKITEHEYIVSRNRPPPITDSK